MLSDTTNIVIVGGGAGGLELAVRLARRDRPGRVILVDRETYHIWKPSLHEVAAGTLDIHREGLSYFMLARDHGFTFMAGAMSALDRAGKRIHIDAVHVDGQEILPARWLPYEHLVLAVGSVANYFNVPGAEEHAIALDSTPQAEHFRLRLLHRLALLNRDKRREPDRRLHLAIVGAGATGVELAAELTESIKHLVFYGLHRVDPARDIRITLLEGAPRILSTLPERTSDAACRLLRERGIEVRTSVRVRAVSAQAVTDAHGNQYPADLCVWTAGVQAPAFLGDLGLLANARHQIVADRHLRSSDPAVYAMGDCAQVPGEPDGTCLPARAQVAHQQAKYLADLLEAGKNARAAPGFRYHDHGSLVALGQHRGVGNLMGSLAGRRFFVQGLLARLMYMGLHLNHHRVILGPIRTAFIAAGRLLLKRSAPRVKLH